jgi:hypothetical protein
MISPLQVLLAASALALAASSSWAQPTERRIPGGPSQALAPVESQACPDCLRNCPPPGELLAGGAMPPPETAADGLAELCVPPLGAVPGGACATESWLQRPYSIGWIVGTVQGGPVIRDWVGMDQGLQAGLRLGYDFSESFAVESRFAYASVGLYDNAPARLFDGTDHRDADLFQWDVDLAYYPCGDTWLRPYFLWGVGLTDLRFHDRLDIAYHRMMFSLPIGVGAKWQWTERVGVRLDFIDDIAFGRSGFETQNNLSLTLGMEVRFGGPRRTYWPWNPGRHGW